MKNRLKPGDLVRSSYRAPWYGVIVRETTNPLNYIVRVTHDRFGFPLRKPFNFQLSPGWLRRPGEDYEWKHPLDRDARSDIKEKI
jgi:hypothetical protein